MAFRDQRNYAGNVGLYNGQNFASISLILSSFSRQHSQDWSWQFYVSRQVVTAGIVTVFWRIGTLSQSFRTSSTGWTHKATIGFCQCSLIKRFGISPFQHNLTASALVFQENLSELAGGFVCSVHCSVHPATIEKSHKDYPACLVPLYSTRNYGDDGFRGILTWSEARIRRRSS
jgi:hypothetical protein